MTSPFDSVTSMVEANRRLTQTLAEISQASAEAYVRAGSQVAAHIAEQARHVASGGATGLFAEVSPLVANMRLDREAAAKKAVAALTDWQSAWVQACAATLDQTAATEAFRGLLPSWSALKRPAAEGAKPEARAAKPKAAD